MKALVICPTYGRIPYLGRILSSFINQTYDDKHLVIINDDKNIHLDCEYPNVTVLNCNRILLVADKRNLGAAYGKFDIIHPWDDDDVFLPKRLENYMRVYDDPDINAYRNISSYVLYGDKFGICGGTPNSISYRKKHLLEVGGYARTDNFGEDTELHDKLQNFTTVTNDHERDFVYIYGGVNYHLSLQPSPESLAKIAYNQLVKLDLLNKKFMIQPDPEQYNHYLLLDELYKKENKELTVTHLGGGRIDTSHLGKWTV